MTQRQKLMTAIRDYAQASLDGKLTDEGTDILSAIVNFADTCDEGNLPEFTEERRQAEREIEAVAFIVRHDNNHNYDLCE